MSYEETVRYQEAIYLSQIDPIQKELLSNIFYHNCYKKNDYIFWEKSQIDYFMNRYNLSHNDVVESINEIIEYGWVNTEKVKIEFKGSSRSAWNFSIDKSFIILMDSIIDEYQLEIPNKIKPKS